MRYFQVSAVNIFKCKLMLKLYLEEVSRKRKFELTQKIKDISQQLDMFKNQMLKVSDIKLDLKKGTMHLSILAWQKSSVLCEIVAMAYKIKDIIQNYKLVCKLRKR